MKSFIVGIVTIIVLGFLGYLTFKTTVNFINRSGPAPSATPSLSPTPSPFPTPTPTPLPIAQPSTKPAIKGVSTIKKTTTTTTTTSHLFLTLIKTSSCPISYMTEIKDIQGPLTLKYSLKDGYSFGITVWAKDGNELVNNTTYSGTSGTIKTISGVDYLKVRIESKSCASNNNNWLTLTAER